VSDLGLVARLQRLGLQPANSPILRKYKLAERGCVRGMRARSGAAGAASACKTNWQSYRTDRKPLSSILGKRSGRPNPLNRQDLILKLRERFIRCDEQPAISHQPSAKAKTKPNKAIGLKPKFIREMYQKFRKQSQPGYPAYFQDVGAKKWLFFEKNGWYWRISINGSLNKGGEGRRGGVLEAGEGCKPRGRRLPSHGCGSRGPGVPPGNAHGQDGRGTRRENPTEVAAAR
jgi:hypothetical protein